jgi:hypothetical protein
MGQHSKAGRPNYWVKLAEDLRVQSASTCSPLVDATSLLAGLSTSRKRVYELSIQTFVKLASPGQEVQRSSTGSYAECVTLFPAARAMAVDDRGCLASCQWDVDDAQPASSSRALGYRRLSMLVDLCPSACCTLIFAVRAGRYIYNH